MERIDITQNLEDFESHLNNNKRTIFSARFGDGKTFFLREFISRHKKDYYCITLHPINYPIGKNEDIFEYIKRDILSYLSNEPYFKEVDWGKVKNKILDYDTLLAECEFLSDALPPAKLLLTPFRLFKKIDDTYAIDKFFKNFANIKGSIFEQDEFTIAIQETLTCIKEHGMKCLLLIEDMDRLDPGHLFRILNILGAHIDEDKEKNKFGFDNIVLVLDYEATRSIFHYFYGQEANYEGYMDKFLSSTQFKYSILKNAQDRLIDRIRTQFGDDVLEMPINHQPDNSRITITVRNVVSTKSIREIDKILDQLDKIGHTMFEKENKTFLTACPLYGLVKLLVLFNEPSYHYPTICDRITRIIGEEKWFFLGSFICASGTTDRVVIKANPDCIASQLINDVGQIKGYDVRKNYYENLAGTSVQEVIRKAIALAQENVVGGSNVRFVI